jgi:hypothetical protein
MGEKWAKKNVWGRTEMPLTSESVPGILIIMTMWENLHGLNCDAHIIVDEWPPELSSNKSDLSG